MRPARVRISAAIDVQRGVDQHRDAGPRGERLQYGGQQRIAGFLDRLDAREAVGMEDQWDHSMCLQGAGHGD
jgi:hypothetical protein